MSLSFTYLPDPLPPCFIPHFHWDCTQVYALLHCSLCQMAVAAVPLTSFSSFTSFLCVVGRHTVLFFKHSFYLYSAHTQFHWTRPLLFIGPYGSFRGLPPQCVYQRGRGRHPHIHIFLASRPDGAKRNCARNLLTLFFFITCWRR
jgi:hypothetical protein